MTSDNGVFIDSNLTFKQHISMIITEAQKRMGVFFEGLLQDPQILFAKRLQLIFILC